MHPDIKNAIETFLTKTTEPGKIVEFVEMVEIHGKLTVPLPEWYAELFSTYPLAGLSLDYPLYEADDYRTTT